MALKLYDEADIQDIADAIRGKNGSSDTYTVSQMADAITAIPSGGGDNSLLIGVLSNTAEEISLSGVTRLRDGILAGATALKRVSFPDVITVASSAFNGSGVESMYLPKAESFGGNSINNSKITVLALPSLKGSIGTNNLVYARLLQVLDIGPQMTRLQGQSIRENTVLDTLILRSSTAVTLDNINALSGTKFDSAGTGGTLYVPSALISSYQAATNWSTILGYTNNNIQAIEGSIYENTYADGTPIS